jgi:hypothetical protein
LGCAPGALGRSGSHEQLSKHSEIQAYFWSALPSQTGSVRLSYPHPDGGVDLRTFGRLLWLLLDAGKFPDIGPNASLEAAQGMRASGDVLSRMLTGKTLLYGEAATTGPYPIRLNVDGSAAFLRGREPVEVDTGTWSIREDQFCREWKKLEPRKRCLAAVSIGSKIQLFDPMGLMLIEAHLVEDDVRWGLASRSLSCRRSYGRVEQVPTM